MKNKRDILLTVAALVVLFGAACYAQFEMGSYVRRIINLCLIYAIIGLSMNLTNGFAGQFSLGQAGFMAVGAYVVGVFTVPVDLRPNVFYAVPMNPMIADIQLPLWLALLFGGLLAALIAFLIGWPVLRLRGDYLAIATLGFSEIIRILITNAQSWTNGALGIKDIPALNDVRYIFIATAITFLFVTCLINSSYGRAFKAIREDEIAAEAMGVGLFKHKCMAFMLSAFFAGIGGGLYATLLGHHRTWWYGQYHRQYAGFHYRNRWLGIPACIRRTFGTFRNGNSSVPPWLPYGNVLRSFDGVRTVLA